MHCSSVHARCSLHAGRRRGGAGRALNEGGGDELAEVAGEERRESGGRPYGVRDAACPISTG